MKKKAETKKSKAKKNIKNIRGGGEGLSAKLCKYFKEK